MPHPLRIVIVVAIVMIIIVMAIVMLALIVLLMVIVIVTARVLYSIHSAHPKALGPVPACANSCPAASTRSGPSSAVAGGWKHLSDGSGETQISPKQYADEMA